MNHSARGIVVKDNKVLLIYRRNKGKEYYSIPGGNLEPYETLEQAVVREVFEETSIKVSPIKLLGSFVNKSQNKTQHIFECKYIEGEPKLGDFIEKEKMLISSDNYYEPMWVDINKVAKLDIMPKPGEDCFKNFLSKGN